jgi:hypothetical protein
MLIGKTDDDGLLQSLLEKLLLCFLDVKVPPIAPPMTPPTIRNIKTNAKRKTVLVMPKYVRDWRGVMIPGLPTSSALP